MSREEILAKLKEVITLAKPKLDLSTVSEQSFLVTELGIDSLSMLLLGLGVEQKFDIRLDNDLRLQTVSDVIDAIEAKLQ